MRRLALPAALAAALLGACSRGPGPVHVVSVRVSGSTVGEPLREAGMDDAAVEAAARTALHGAGFRLSAGERAHRAVVSVAAVRLAPPGASGGAPRAEVALELELAPAEPGKGGVTRETGTAAVPLAGDPRAAWRTALSDAAARAAEGLALAYAMEVKPIAALVDDLASKDARVREHAVRVLADRRSPDAVPALIARLEDPDPKVAHRAVGALAQTGDPRAVGPLIELSRSGDPLLTARVARLIGDVGGDEAEGYLLTLEAGHPDPRVRRAAREALGELRERKGQAAALSARE
jgi:hypothetical protein